MPQNSAEEDWFEEVDILDDIKKEKKIPPFPEHPTSQVYGPFLKKDLWRKVETKDFTRHVLAVERHYWKSHKKIDRSRGTIVYCYEFKNKLKFVRFKYSRSGHGFDNKIDKYSLVCKNGKVNLFKTMPGPPIKIRNVNVSISMAFNTIFEFKKMKHGAAYERLRPILRRFAKNNGLKIDRKIKIGDNWALGQIYQWIFPLLKTFKRELTLQTSYSIFFKNYQFKQSLKKAFGYSGKALSNIVLDYVEGGCPSIYYLGYVAKGLIPIDYVIEYLKNSYLKNSFEKPEGRYFIDFRKTAAKQNRAFIKALPPNKRIDFLKQTGFKSPTFKDTVRMWHQPIEEGGNQPLAFPERIGTCAELHDEFIRIQNRQNQVKNNRVFDYDDKIKKINGVEIDNLKIVLPKDSTELAEWSNVMNNCVRGYDSSIASKSSLVIGVFKDGVLTYNIEIRKRVVTQFSEKRNRMPENKEDVKRVKQFLFDRDIVGIKESRYETDEDVNENLAINA